MVKRPAELSLYLGSRRQYAPIQRQAYRNQPVECWKLAYGVSSCNPLHGAVPCILPVDRALGHIIRVLHSGQPESVGNLGPVPQMAP